MVCRAQHDGLAKGERRAAAGAYGVAQPVKRRQPRPVHHHCKHITSMINDNTRTLVCEGSAEALLDAAAAV